LGGVIVNWHNSWLIEEVSKTFDLSSQLLGQEFHRNLNILSSGKITEDEFWSHIGNKLNSSELERQDSLLEPIFRKFVSVNDSVVKLSRELKKTGVSVGILSNTEPITFSVVEELIPLNHFDYKFLSYKIGSVKPNPTIYKYVVENIPFEKDELFFIDDTELNVKSANDYGIRAIQFETYKKLIGYLRRIKILDFP
jgi:putative hydrolase of the HAD superfamily